MSNATSTGGEIEAFYGRWSDVYDVVATALPTRWRARAVDALALSPGDTVVEMGCGTGVNLELLRERVGSSGRVVGIDLTPSMLHRAQRRIDRAGWDNVSLIRGDASRPPISEATAVFGTFVVGLLPEPKVAVETWCTLATDRVALLDGNSSTHPIGRLCNPLFGAFVGGGVPTDSFRETLDQLTAPTDARHELDAAVNASRNALLEHTTHHQFESFGLGFLGVMSGSTDRE